MTTLGKDKNNNDKYNKNDTTNTTTSSSISCDKNFNKRKLRFDILHDTKVKL